MGEKMNTPFRIPADRKFELTKDPMIRLAELKNEVGPVTVDQKKVKQEAEKVIKYVKKENKKGDMNLASYSWQNWNTEGTIKTPEMAKKYAEELLKKVQGLLMNYSDKHRRTFEATYEVHEDNLAIRIIVKPKRMG